jgi:hypothetical protein
MGTIMFKDQHEYNALTGVLQNGSVKVVALPRNQHPHRRTGLLLLRWEQSLNSTIDIDFYGLVGTAWPNHHFLARHWRFTGCRHASSGHGTIAPSGTPMGGHQL